MTHFVVILDSTYDFEQFIHVLAVKHTYEEAKAVFDKNIKEEKDYAERNGFVIYEEYEDLFEAGEDGRWAEGHTKLYIEEVSEK